MYTSTHKHELQLVANTPAQTVPTGSDAVGGRDASDVSATTAPAARACLSQYFGTVYSSMKPRSLHGLPLSGGATTDCHPRAACRALTLYISLPVCLFLQVPWLSGHTSANATLCMSFLGVVVLPFCDRSIGCCDILAILLSMHASWQYH
jgi:hypothetical protein